MKAIFLIIVATIIQSTYLAAQIIPLGLYVDIDGKVKFWECEANYNGNVDDTVFITLKGETQLYDLRNLKYDYLTVLESPDPDWTTPSNLDPSRINDTTRYSTFDDFGFSLFSHSIFSIDSTSTIYFVNPDNQTPIQKQYLFSDDIRGVGLNDSIVNLVKTKLNNLINLFYGKYLPEEQINQLRTELSYHDTVIEKIAFYDYLVDMIVSYNYDKNDRLTKVIGYHWSQGIEVDSLNYDKSGRLVYFAREHLGTSRNELFFKYNKFGRVTTVKQISYSLSNENQKETVYTNEIKFTYDKKGTMNSKSDLEEGNWTTNYFVIK